MANDRGALHIDLNGLDVSLDEASGGIVGLRLDGPGQLLEAGPDEAALVDVAYPLPQFEPLRLATRFTTGTVISREGMGVRIATSALGPSRELGIEGSVSAEVTLRPTADGRSVVLSCRVTNNSPRPVRQVVFPDLAGLLPVAGVDHTILKTGGFGSAPFRELRLPDVDQFYAQSGAFREHNSGGMFQDMIMRWLDLGGLNGGLSLFPRRWGWDAHVKVLLHLSEVTGRLRLMCVNAEEVPPGDTWESGEWVLTAHRQGWAQGLEPYREWIHENLKREAPVPPHVRRGLGFRSVWMCQNQPDDPAGDAVWRFQDLPELAREAKAHGLTELVLWGTHPGFTLPLPPPFPHLGTEEGLARAVAECREMGVRVAPFISMLQANKATGPRYGLSVPETGGWTYHTELIPRFNPPYAGNYACAQVDTSHSQWQADALAACQHLVDLGMTSLSWDQFLCEQREPNIPTLVRQVRRYARDRDPEAAFSGEELYNIEIASELLDYTWVWGGWGDFQAYTSAFPAPRRNININRSVAEVKRGFLDNLYLNVWPAMPGGINGSARIEACEELSQALKQCAKLRAQFLSYFTEGTFVGNCVLTEPCPGTHLCGYALPDRLLVLAMNVGAPRALTFAFDAAPWLTAPGSACEVRHYDGSGRLLDTQDVPLGPHTVTTPPLQGFEITIYEVTTG